MDSGFDTVVLAAHRARGGGTRTGRRGPESRPLCRLRFERIFYSTCSGYGAYCSPLTVFDYPILFTDPKPRPERPAAGDQTERSARDLRPHSTAEHADRPYTKDCFYSHHRSKANLPAACTTPLRPVSRNASTSNHLAAATASHENALLGSVVDDWDAPHGRGWDAVVACDGRPQGIAEDDTGEPVHLGVFDIKARKPA